MIRVYKINNYVPPYFKTKRLIRVYITSKKQVPNIRCSHVHAMYSIYFIKYY